MAALAPPERGSQRRPIVLIGFMGAGKTTAAQALARRWGVEPLDADAVIEQEAGEQVARIFESRGEEGFRALEERVALSLIEEAVGRGAGVLALGGGAVESAPVRERLAGPDVLTVWLRVDAQTAWRRSEGSGRPLARDRESFTGLLARREELYREAADAVIDAGEPDVAERAAPWLATAAATPGGRLCVSRTWSAEVPALVGRDAVRALELAGASAPAQEGVERGGPDRWFGVVDRTVAEAHPALVRGLEQVIEVEGAESSKTLAEAERILIDLAGAGARRDDGIVAVGGGVVGDLAGFCAATYQRGVPVVHVPTTLVAQVDSAYGGKTGVDLPIAKNYAGAFHQPRAVLADPALLSTLPAVELAAGMAEVIKTALLAGGPLWERVRALEPVRPGDFAPGSPRENELAGLVFRCACFKLDVVADDERDAGRRAILNLGHTVGHAIEAVTGYRRYRHGEAVALGLLAALRLSGAGELRSEVDAVARRHGLPTTLDPAVEVESVVEAVGLDKKRTSEGVGFVLLERPGEPVIGQPVDSARLAGAVEELR